MGSSLDPVVRLDPYLCDIYFTDRALALVSDRFKAGPPVAVVIGAELGGIREVKLNAIVGWTWIN